MSSVGALGGFAFSSNVVASVCGKIPSNESNVSALLGGTWHPEPIGSVCVEIGNERRDSIGQLEEKLRVLQVKRREANPS